jgi:fibronectin type 3 domain-containing protein
MSPLDVTRFSTQFTFQVVDTTQPGADGFTFTIQGVGSTALGPFGGGLGYGPDAAGGTGGIPNSVAVKFDLFSNAGEGYDSTGLYTNGASPTLAGSIDLSGTGIDLHSQHVFNVAMTYDGAKLGVTTTDTTTQASASQSYTVNIPGLVGSNTGFVGFTAGSGGLTADQRILTWSYTPASAGPPAAPTNLSATASSGTQVTLNWTDNSTNESAFLIERKTGAGGTYAQIGQTNEGATTLVDTGLATNTQYFYRVRATNAAGFSGYSNEVSVTTPVPPITPSGARTTLITSTEIDLAWQDNSNNETGFKVFRKTSSIGTFNLVTTLPPSSTSYQDTGLTPGTQYDYHIQAFNLAGFSDFTGLSTATLTTPPTNVIAQRGGNQIALSWTAPIGAATYNLYRSTVPGGEGAVPFQIGLTSTSFTDTNLANGTSYYYQVTAIDGGGESGKSIESSAITTPSAPGGLIAAPGPLQVSIIWNASAGAATYNVYRSTASGAEGATPFKTGLAATTFTDTGLTSGTTYYYQVTAVNAAGESSKSLETSAPAQSSGLSFGSGFTGAGSLLAFNGSTKLNGTALQLTDGGTGEAASAFSNTRFDATRFATQFTFQVLNTTNPSADGFTFAIQGTGPTALGPGGGGLGFGPDSPGNGVGIANSVAVKFDLYSNAGEGSDSTGLYTNGASPTNVGSIDLTSTGVDLHSQHVFNVSMTYDGTTLKVTITDTTTNASTAQSYSVNIPGIIGATTGYVGFTAGSGGLTATQRILSWLYTPSAAPPGAPAGLAATPSTNQMSLSWTPSASATSYNVYRSSISGGEGLTPYRTGVTGTSFVDTGVASGGTYFYQVSAVGAGGESTKSGEASATLIPAAPINLTSTVSAGQATLTWTPSAGATSYRVYRSSVSGGEGSTPIKTGLTSANFTDIGLIANTTYYYQVTAVNAAGESARSSELAVVTNKPGLNFASGFAGAGTQLTLNRSAKINGSSLQLTDGGTAETASAFSTNAFDVTRFTTQFNFQLSNATADGFTFAIQGVGANAVGAGGGGLGYSGLAKSVAVKFDLYNNAGEGTSSTGLYTNGATPTNVGSINLIPAGINLRSGHVFSASITYDGTTLKVTITDTSTNVSASQSYAVNIPAIVGGNTAFVGFTAGTGGLSANQNIRSWTYQPQ